MWRKLRWLIWAAIAVTLAAQAWLHRVVDRHLQPDVMLIADQRLFRLSYEWYLIASTAQWVLCLAFVLLSVQAWRSEDTALTSATIAGSN